MIAGLEAVTSGTIALRGRDVTDVPARDRDVAMVFQSYALYPHMTVRDNLGLNLQVRKMPKKEIVERIDSVARMLQLEGLLDRKPGQLSGGQRQRVALGRAIIRRPNVFLMDEPLSNLDLKLREETRTELKKLHESLRITTVYVTHDQSEALVLSDRIGIMTRRRAAAGRRSARGLRPARRCLRGPLHRQPVDQCPLRAVRARTAPICRRGCWSG